jgi:anthranilate synthase/aminodeoxychorismate synthase-like glutamine amidotransferase
MHGKTSWVHHDGEQLFAGLPHPFEAGRYHSLAANRETLPEELVVTAQTKEGEIMGVRHRELAVVGVQFHPESVLTPNGPQLLDNFLRMRAAGA